MPLADDAARLEDALSALTAALPALPPDELLAHAARADELAAATAGATAALASTLARTLRAYADGMVPLEGWGLVASSASTLARAIGEPAGGHGGAALAAARFELESLLPSPGTSPAPRVASPDVPLTSLRRRS